jgi:hypothetical protein
MVDCQPVTLDVEPAGVKSFWQANCPQMLLGYFNRARRDLGLESSQNSCRIPLQNALTARATAGEASGLAEL